ncbi:MAG TPA: DUF2269 domain-containing protein [Dehalococcoidia bacterium]|nr:DUF2269 domain-containing protein [Dehalococcoidia bacterium]
MLEIFLAVHILSAVVFVGNIITAAYWKVRADRSGNLETIALTAQGLLRADYIFTLPGIVGLLATGILMVGITGWGRFQEPWLSISFILLVVTGIIWAAILLPLQRRMVRLAQLGAARGTPDPAYRQASKRWAILGGIGTLLPVVILFLMVLKPAI